METTWNSLKTPFHSPSELSGDFINALQGLGADRGLDLAEQPGGESAATVQPPPRHLPPAVPSLPPVLLLLLPPAGRLTGFGAALNTEQTGGGQKKKWATRPKLSVR